MSKIECRICGHRGNILVHHLKSVHGYTIEQYQDEFTGAEIASEAGKQVIARRRAQAKTTDPNERPTEDVSVRKLFDIDLGTEIKDNKEVPIDLHFCRFLDPPTETARLNPDYVFPKDVLLELLVGLHCRDRILLTGHTGTGKTSLVEQVAVRLGFNCVKISLDGGISRDDLVGCWQYHPEKGTIFVEGILPRAMRLPGTIILLDEWDVINSDCSFVLQRPLQPDDGCLQILESNELIPLHPQSIICATANTIGLGDDTGLYSQGTSVQNYAQLNRFGTTLRVGYPPVGVEHAILKKKNPALQTSEITMLVRTINLVRDAYTKGEIAVPLSTRDLLNWATKYLVMGKALAAARIAFLNRMPAESALVVEGLVQRTCETL